MRCYKDEEKCTSVATHGTEKDAHDLGIPFLAARAVQLWHGQAEGGRYCREGRAHTAVLASQECHCPTVRLKAESRNVTSSQECFIWTYQSDHIKSCLKHHRVGRETESSSPESLGQAGAECTCFAHMVKALLRPRGCFEGRALRIA